MGLPSRLFGKSTKPPEKGTKKKRPRIEYNTRVEATILSHIKSVASNLSEEGRFPSASPEEPIASEQELTEDEQKLLWIVRQSKIVQQEMLPEQGNELREKIDIEFAELNKEQAKKTQSIVEMMIDDSWERLRWAFIALLLAGGLLFFWFRGGIDFPIWSAIVLVVFAVTLYANQVVFEYRVRKGYYGTNDNEAREIVKYIFTHGEDIGKGGGGGGRRIAPEPELEPKTSIIPEGEVAS